MPSWDDFLWSRLPASLLAAADDELARRSAAWRAAAGAPRDFAAALRFILAESRNWPRLLLYGAGAHTKKLLEAGGQGLRDRVAAIIDRAAPEVGVFCGVATITPAQAAASDDALAVVAHPVAEEAMATALRQAGMAAERILTVYENPAYRSMALALAAPMATADADRLAGVARNVVVGSAKWAIASDRELAAALPPDVTVKIHFDPVERFTASPVFPTLDSGHSLDLLRLLLERLQPANIYLRTYVQTAPLAGLLRDWLPEARLIQEVYDFAGLLDERMLKRWMEFSDQAIDTSLLAELDTARRGDLVISKRREIFWPPGIGTAGAPYRHYFGGMPPASPSQAPPHSAADAAIRILYAGILPRPDQQSAHPSDYDFLPLLERLAADGAFQVGLYNQMHDSPDQDRSFQNYIDRYRTGHVRYHRRVPYDKLLEEATSFHFGWLCRQAGDERIPDTRLVFGQRFTGYVFAGLPVLVDPGWEAMAELTTRFGAGLVLPEAADAETVAGRIAGADLPALKRGVAALRDYMTKHNIDVLETIRQIAG